MDNYFLAISLILAGGTLPLLLSRHFKVMKITAIALIITGSLAGLSAAVDLLHNAGGTLTASFPFLDTLTLDFQIDYLSAFFLIPIFVIAPLAALYSYNYLENNKKSMRVAANYFFYSILTISMVFVACANNIITFALAWEMMSLSSFFLVIYDFEKSSVRKAGYLYFVFAQAGAMALFASFAIIYGYTGSLGFATFGTVPDSAKALIFTLAFIGFGSKAGIMPLHVWLPHAHPVAPSHVSAVMSGVMIKMGIYGIIRIYNLLHPQGIYCSALVITIGAITGVMGVVYAMGQRDLKRLLAYSSAENIGIILIGIGLGMLGLATDNPSMAILGFAGGLMHVLNHAIFKSLLFMGAGAVLHRTGTLTMDLLGGLIKRMRVTGIAFFIGSIAICGLPPFNGFVSEFLIYIGAFHGVKTQDTTFIFIILAVLSLAIIGGLAIACFTKVIGVVYLGEPRTNEADQAKPAGLTIKMAMTILAFFCAIIGLFPQAVIPLVMRAAIVLLPRHTLATGLDIPVMTTNLSLAAISFALVVLLIVGLRKLTAKGTPEISGTWGCGFSQPNCRMQYTGTSFSASFLDFYKPFVLVREKFTGIHDIFPTSPHYQSETVDISETGIQKGIIKPIMHYTVKLRWLQHGHIQLYIGYIFFAMLGLLFMLVL